ncbi:hypothetical protein [Acinetobacter sp. ANC 3813]|uniref:hypothetical protein n=1 Tax=Acinetobacter sp. ANC 3813 TaxID=1977873 RepID=UPI000A34D428|nr:hypothetical protein [Acinetobacter sp. ANC 3813]OTG87906.1 hypothetical protein B9T34_16360 [Acinetobacter sp. ANC 3813]
MKEVTEFDLRHPDYKDPDLKPEHFEFDGEGKIARKDRFERGMRRVHGMLIDLGLSSSRDAWTVKEELQKLKKYIEDMQRLKDLVCIVEQAPEDAEYFNLENREYVKNIDVEHLDIAKAEPSESHLINHDTCGKDGVWTENSAWLENIHSLVMLADMKEEILVMSGAMEACK